MKIHFISIGGSVMHQLAIALKRKGYDIRGSDDEIFEPARSNLQKENILPSKTGWFPDLITDELDVVILGMHAKPGNPELEKAKTLGLPIYSFPEYIYKESQDKTRIVVGGSHGKTTTTAMIMHVLQQTKIEFDYLVGARLQGFDQSVNISDAPIIICEGDEYPASAIEKRPKFHFLFPHIAILTGIAWDHINVFPTFEIYLEQFRIFIKKIETNGQLIYNEEDVTLKDLINDTKRADIRYHPYRVPAHSISMGETTVIIEGAESKLKVFGHHNLLNLYGAWLACKQLKISAIQFANAIGSFTGAAKRLELIAKNDHTTIYRDFAHAPSKVKATIDAVKKQLPHRKLIAILELHTFSSLNEKFMQEYKGVMDGADQAVVFYSPHALELKQLPVLKIEMVQEGFQKKGLLVIAQKTELENWLKTLELENSTLLFMSSGNYDNLNIEAYAKQIVQTAV